MPFGFYKNNVALRANAGIDHRDMQRAARKILVTAREPKPGFRGPMRENIVREIDDFRISETRENLPFNYTDEGIAKAKVGSESDDAVHVAKVATRRARVNEGNERTDAQTSGQVTFVNRAEVGYDQ